MASGNPLLRVKQREEQRITEMKAPDMVGEVSNKVQYGTDAYRDMIHDQISKRIRRQRELSAQPREGNLLKKGGKRCKRCGKQKGGSYTTIQELGTGPNVMTHYVNNSNEMCRGDLLQKGGSYYTQDFDSTMASAFTDSHGDLVVPPRLDVSPVESCQCAGKRKSRRKPRSRVRRKKTQKKSRRRNRSSRRRKRRV
jgi:hypothetical protein